MSVPNGRYSSVAIALHWAMAALIIFMIWLGHNMENHEARFQLHKSIGITLLVLTIARIVWRLYNKPPPLPSDVKPVEARLSKLVQFGFYALMLLIPLGGWLLVSVSPFAVPTVLFDMVSWPSLPVPRNEKFYETLAFLHGKGSTIGFLALLLLHIAGAVKHEIGHESGVLRRILPGRRLRPLNPPRGAVITILSSLGFFAAIAAIPLISQVGSAQTDGSPAPTALVANWQIVEDTKSIRFDFSHDGGDYTGQIETWTAEIEFYEDQLAISKVIVEVDLTSALTGKKLYDDSLKSKEWFDVKNTPKATINLSGFERGSEKGTYKSVATLDIKGAKTDVPFSFTLEINGDRANLTGSTKLTRKSLNLGQESDPDADWVSEDVIVNVSLEAQRLGG